MKFQNGFGSIVCLDKTGKKRRKPYAARITSGWKDGKQVRKYIGYYKTQHEALIALAEYHKNGYDVELSNLTLGEVYERWMKRIESNVSVSVLKGHKMARQRFDRLANIQIAKIKADHLQDWMDSITDLSGGSKKRVKSTMMQIWKYAIKNDIVTTNYAEHIEIFNKTEKTGSIFTEQEIQTLWDDVDNPVAQWILILIYTGMRIGELLSITSDTIYLDEHYMVGGSKTEAGIDRVIPLHNAILPLVKNLLGEEKYLIHNKHGYKVTYSTALAKFKAYMKAHEWEHLPHDTRKTAVSLMHTAGIPIETIRVIVGHSAKGITEKVYLYKNPSELVDTINTIEIV